MNRFLGLGRWEDESVMPLVGAETEWEELVIDRPACSLPLMPCPFYRISQYCCHADNTGGACPLLHRAQATDPPSVAPR
jgi:hypothetical protein